MTTNNHELIKRIKSNLIELGNKPSNNLLEYFYEEPTIEGYTRLYESTQRLCDIKHYQDKNAKYRT